MGRKSALTEAQWAEIIRRNLNGESIRSLAKEFGLSESAVREKISAQAKKIKNAGNQIVAAKRAVNELPFAAQIAAHTYAEKIMAMQDLSADVAINGLTVAKRIGDSLTKKLETAKDKDLMTDKALSQLAKSGTVINIHSRPAFDAMEIERKKSDKALSNEERTIHLVNAPPDDI